MTEIQGSCDPRFEGVRSAMAANFAEHGDVGASVAVVLDGEVVVDLWGGTTDAAGTPPWQRGHDHQRLVDDQDDDGALRPAPRRPRRARPPRPGGEVLARVQGRRQGARRRPPPARAHRRAVGVAGADRARRPLRLGAVHLPAGGPGAVVGAGHGIGLPRHHPGLPRRRGRAPGQRGAVARHVLPRPRSPSRSAPTSTSAPVREHDDRVAPGHPPARPQRSDGRLLGRPRTRPRDDRTLTNPPLDASQSYEIAGAAARSRPSTATATPAPSQGCSR